MSKEADQEVLRRHLPSLVAPVVELVVNRLREALEASRTNDYATILIAFGQAIELLDASGVSVTALVPEADGPAICSEVLEALTGIKVPEAAADYAVDRTGDVSAPVEVTEDTDLPDELQEAIRAAFKETYGVDAQIVGYTPPS